MINKILRKITNYYLKNNLGYDLEAIEFACQEVPKVYCHITNNKLSKINHESLTVISLADDIVSEMIEKIMPDERKLQDEMLKNVTDGNKHKLESILEDFSKFLHKEYNRNTFDLTFLHIWIVCNIYEIAEKMENFAEDIDLEELLKDILSLEDLVEKLDETTYKTLFEF
jgi:hypothetical protein